MQIMIHQALFGVFESTLQWSCICRNGLLTRFKELSLSFFFTLFEKNALHSNYSKKYFHLSCNNEAFNLYNTHNSQAFKHQDNSSRYLKASRLDSQSEKEKKGTTTTLIRYSPASHIRSPAFFKENPSLFCCGIWGGGLWAMIGEVAESLLSSIVILDWFWFCCGVGGIFVGDCGSY